MDLQTAIDFIRPAVGTTEAQEQWVDLGAGSGLFTLALDQLLLPGSTIYAADKNPHLLYRLELEHCRLVIEELDFTRDFRLPPMDGILMANALHYAPEPVAVLERLAPVLRPGGRLLMIEYETERPLPPWIPYPLPFDRLSRLAEQVDGLGPPEPLNQTPSNYGHDHIYLARIRKLDLYSTTLPT